MSTYENEECKDCGEDHSVVGEEMLVKEKRLSRLYTSAWFASISLLGVTAYMMAGTWGPVGVVAFFGIYFFHLNMVASLNRTEAIKYQMMLDAGAGDNNPKPNAVTNYDMHRQYL